jgi:hypothetical protein
MRTLFQFVACILLSGLVAFSQQTTSQKIPTPPPAAAAKPSSPVVVDDKFVHEHFGNEFTLMPEFPAMLADFNGDGIEDIVLAARAKSPMLDAGGFNYRVIDPYHSFYGFGDPRITASFTTEEPSRKSIVLLVIHGAGSDAWRGAEPKGKFVLINIPVKSVSLRRIKMGKKVVAAIGVEEYGGDQTTSAIFWDGNPKKVTGNYKYQPIGAALE